MKASNVERRAFLTTAGALLVAGAAGRVMGQTAAADAGGGGQACAVFNQERQAAVTPDAALEMLKQGNERFVSGNTVNCDLLAQVKDTAGAQAPFAVIVGCIDSRVSPELVFDQHIGDIFAARIAGNFVNTDIIGSLEFATKIAGARLIAVIGHTKCGAVMGAIDNAQMGNLTATLANIRPSVLKVTNIEGPQDSSNANLVQAVADQNAKDAAEMLTARSDVLRGLVEEGKLKIVAGMLDIGTGRVTWFA